MEEYVKFMIDGMIAENTLIRKKMYDDFVKIKKVSDHDYDIEMFGIQKKIHLEVNYNLRSHKYFLTIIERGTYNIMMNCEIEKPDEEWDFDTFGMNPETCCL